MQFLRTMLRGHAEVIDAALHAQIAAGRLVNAGGALAVDGWVPKLDSNNAAIAARVVARLDAAGSEPPSVEEMSGELGCDLAAVLRFLERRGDVVQVEQDRYYATRCLNQVIDRLRAIMSGGAELGPSELREKLGLSRKFLIPLLEYCDRAGYTNRGAVGRVWHGT